MQAVQSSIQVVEGVRLVDNLADVPGEVSRLRSSGVDVCYDLETTSLDPFKDRLVTLAFKPRSKQAVIIDVRHWSDAQLLILGSMLEVLFDGVVTIVGMNLKYDLSWGRVKLGLAGHRAYDCMLAEQVILGLGWSSARDRHISLSMEGIATRYGLEVEKESRSYFIGLDQRPEWYLPFPEQQIKYMRQDVSIPHRIKELQQAAIEQYGLQEVIDLEMRDIFPTAGQEVWGVQIDRGGWLAVIDRVAEIAADLERKLHLGVEGEYEGLDVHVLKVRNDRYMERWQPYEKWIQERDTFIASNKEKWDASHKKGDPGWGDAKKELLEWWYEHNGKLTKPPTNKDGVNLGSWQQVRDGFNDLGIPVESVSEETLTPYIGQHPLVQVYIDYSHARKIGTVYGREKDRKGKAFIDLLDEHDRLRASYQQIGADTGRKSSYIPNLQQIPDTGVGKELRQHVIAAPGYVLVDADLPNIELRVVANESGDEYLLNAFAAGGDIHSSMAGIMFGLAPEQATKEWADTHNVVLNGREVVGTSYRKLTKTCNFALLYGAGNGRLAVTLHQPIEVATRLRGVYYETFATAIEWLNQQKNRLEVARRAGQRRVYAATRSGRRRWFTTPVFPQHPANGGRVTVEAQEQWDLDVEEWKKQMGSIRRQLANHVIQGLAADIMKEAECLWYERYGYDEECRWIASIHDEGIVEVIPSRAEEAARSLEEVMMQAMGKYLKVVNLGKVAAVISNHWQH